MEEYTVVLTIGSFLILTYYTGYMSSNDKLQKKMSSVFYFGYVKEQYCFLLTLLIGAEGARLLRECGAGETPQALCAEEAPHNARGKRSAWSGNQQTNLTKPLF